MSVSTYMGLQTALRGLLASQRALDVTAHNVANANTTGYTRQSASLSPSAPLQTTDGWLGTGVNVTEYTRIRDQFLDVQLRAQTMLSGSYAAKQEVLEQVELALNEPTSTGISSLLSKFWQSWQDVANAPENLATRQALVQTGNALATGIQTLASQLQRLEQQTGDNAEIVVADVNATVASVRELNVQIGAAVQAGQQPSIDLLDRRDVLLDKLATLVNLTVTRDADGSGNDLGTVTLAIVDSSGTSSPLLEPSGQTLLDAAALPASLTSGRLAGLVEGQTLVQGYRSSLDTFAHGLATSVNGALAGGFPLAGAAADFFVAPAAVAGAAASLAVTPALFTDPNRIPVSQAAGTPGDGSIAIAVAGLRGGTADRSYTNLVTTIGSEAQSAKRALANAQTLTDALTNRRESLSGVSLDEEMTNLIRFQRGYQASARALSAMDDLLDTLISRTGRVGL